MKLNKNFLLQLGITLLLITGTFFIINFSKVEASDVDSLIGSVSPPDPISSNPNAVNIYVTTIINTVLFFGVVAALIYIVYGGIRWLMAGGDVKALEAARNTIIQAVIGLILLSTAFAIAKVLDTVMKPKTTGPTSVCTYSGVSGSACNGNCECSTNRCLNNHTCL